MYVLCCPHLHLLAARVYPHSFILVYIYNNDLHPLAQSFQAPRYPGDWRESVLSVPKVPWGLVGLSSFSPPGTLGTGGTQSFQAPRYPKDWGTQFFQAPKYTLGTGGTQTLSAPRQPGDWRDSVLFAPLVLWGLVGLKAFPSPRYPGD